MQDFSQSGEQKIILDYFGTHIGSFLSIGEYDGITYSNTRALALHGWSGVCLEPSLANFERLQNIYLRNELVDCYNYGIADFTGRTKFYENTKGREHHGVVSTMHEKELERWRDSEDFIETEVAMFTWEDFYTFPLIPKRFDFISIDAEGCDLMILKQIDLRETNTKLVCVEWNGKDFDEYDKHARKFGMNLIAKNAENLIYGIL